MESSSPSSSTSRVSRHVSKKRRFVRIVDGKIVIRTSSSPELKKTISPITITLDDSITGLKDMDEKPISEKQKEIMTKLFDEDYFCSYERCDIHFRMIGDKVRTNAYKEALELHKDTLEDKVVMDVGCGTGILSLFAAKAGAKEVFAVERSSMAEQAKKIVSVSQWYHRIQVIQGSVEHIELPEWRPKVDIILSEWMGYSLLYESMLDSVLVARDRFLQPGGLMFPDKCGLYLFASEDMSFYEWKYENFNTKLDDLDLSYFKKVSLGIPVVKRVHQDKVVTNTVPLIHFDLYTMKKEDVNFEVDFELTVQNQNYICALSTYFTVMFPQLTKEKCCYLSTSPFLPITHWKQTCFFLNGYIPVFKDEIVTGTFKAMQNAKNKRRIDFVIKVDYEGRGGSFHQQNEYSLI